MACIGRSTRSSASCHYRAPRRQASDSIVRPPLYYLWSCNGGPSGCKWGLVEAVSEAYDLVAKLFQEKAT
eukprot:1430545-Amphidinium_carterae.1